MGFNKVMFGEDSGETAISDLQGLAQALEGFFKITDMGWEIGIFEIRRLNHIQFFVEGSMEKSSTNIKLCEVVVFDRHNEEGLDTVKLGNETESLDVIYAIVLGETSLYKASFEAVNVA